MATGRARTRQDFGLTRRKPYRQGRRSGFSGIKGCSPCNIYTVSYVLYSNLLPPKLARWFRKHPDGGWFRPQLIGRLGADAKRQANTHGSKGTGIEDLLAVDHEDGVAADEVPNLPAQAQGMNRGL